MTKYAYGPGEVTIVEEASTLPSPPCFGTPPFVHTADPSLPTPFRYSYILRDVMLLASSRRPASSLVDPLPLMGKLPIGAIRLFTSRPASWRTTPMGKYAYFLWQFDARSWACTCLIRASG